MRESLHVHEVGLRDGLQNEKTQVSTAGKAQLLGALARAGVKRFEATSFVSPKAVPQMADAAEVMAVTAEYPQIRASALVINEKGYERAVLAGAREIAVVVVISETLAARNSRMTVAESLAACRAILARAAAGGLHRRVYLAPAWVCPYEGAVARDHVIRCAEGVLEAGVDELAIADTIGHAHPQEVAGLFETLVWRYGPARLAGHFHDTQALALANVAAAIGAGVRTFDASVGGLGGCPFAPGAAGNLATEDLVLLAEKMGFETGIDLASLWSAVSVAEELVKRPVGGRTRAWWERAGQRSTSPRAGEIHAGA